jgi:hypothetical protein
MPYMKEKEIKKEKPVKKTRRSSKKKKFRRTDMNMFVYNNEQKLEIIKVPNKFAKNYISDFGVMTVRTREEIESWLYNLQMAS